VSAVPPHPPRKSAATSLRKRGEGEENYALAISGNTASILVFSVAALNGLTI
jgi:hypothetical protein